MEDELAKKKKSISFKETIHIEIEKYFIRFQQIDY